MLGSVVCFMAMSVLVKLVREGGMSTAEVMLWRMAPGALVVAAQMRRRAIPVRPRRPGAVFARAICGGLAMALYFWALSRLSLLQFSVIGLSQPVLVALVSIPLLGERLRLAAVAALGLALVGAILVVVPDAVFAGRSSDLGAVPLLPALAAVGYAFLSAVAHAFVRRATRATNDGAPADAPQTVVLHFSVLVAIAAAVVALAQGPLHGPPVSLGRVAGYGALLGIATFGVVGQLLLSAAYARANAPETAMVGYARIPLGFGADVLLWGAMADVSGLVGAVGVVVAGALLVRGQRPPDSDVARETG